MTVYIHRAHTADSLTAVVVEGDRILVLADQLLVQNVHHLKERRTLEDVFEFVGLKVTFCFRSRLSPNANVDVDVAIHLM